MLNSSQLEAMYRNGRHFAVRLTHLPVELVKEVLDQLVRNDADVSFTRNYQVLLTRYRYSSGASPAAVPSEPALFYAVYICAIYILI